ncbi:MULTISPECIES: SDR family oxidoreductase [Rhodanobacter]|uniref:SDR family oxidoreductase n=1 Tax=Rhodanobacter TaxID=75309 RepID=UPI0004012F21|nr:MULTISPECIES: SDR family oxidoreductase [Rhodanobacter]UJJ53466.1 SDR family oxidoreductase [Rhodanobacter thiooxydans]
MTNLTRTLFNLDGQTALITGGSRGLGLQIAEALGDYGARILLSARKADELKQAQAHLQRRGIESEWVVADVAQPESVHALVDAALARMGRIDVLVNNAGTSWGAPAEDHPLEAWDKVFDLNVRGLFLLSQQVGKRSMIVHGHGRIINIASIAGLRGNPPGSMQTIAYNSAKAAVVNFTRSLAGEWGIHGITVNAIAPGFFPSKMTRGLIEQVGEEALLGNAPLRRIGGEQDLKGAALLFASGAGSHITGQVLAVDGGYTAV